MAQWFRVWHGLHSDSKLSMVADRLKLPRAFVVASWTYLLELASAGNPRGDCGEIDAELASYTLGIEPAQFQSILASFRQRKLLEGNLVCKWDDRQPVDATSAERMRNKREAERWKAKALELDEKQKSVTVCDDPLRQVTPEQNRAEQKQTQIQSRADTEQKAPAGVHLPSGFVSPPDGEPHLPPLPASLHPEARAILWAFDRARAQLWPEARPRRISAETAANDRAIAEAWAQQGMTDEVFVEGAEDRWRWLASSGKHPPGSLSYFANLFADLGWTTPGKDAA